MVRETDLYPPIKAFLEGQGYTVKAEVGAADLVALRGAEEPVIVELKTRFSLALFHQGVERLALSDLVYLAVPRGAGRGFAKALTANTALCRRLGLGLLTVRLSDGFVEAHCDPGPYRPRIAKAETPAAVARILAPGGRPQYRWRGAGRAWSPPTGRTRCAAPRIWPKHGPSRGRDVKDATGVDRATEIMRADHYGWFERVGLGTYALTPKGREGLAAYGAPDP